MRRLWPLFLLLIADAIALLAVLQLPSPGAPVERPTLFSTLVAGLVLLTGLLPALLRPGRETLLAGCLAVALSSVLIIPFESRDLPAYFFRTAIIQSAPAYLVLRLLNGVSIAPLAFHLAARFPKRQPVGRGLLAAAYMLSLGLLLLLLETSQKWVRISAGLLLMVLAIGLIVAAGYLLLRLSRRPDPSDPRPAQQARLLFTCITLAGVPALLRPLGLVFRVELIPYSLSLAALTLLPAGIAYTVLRTDLFGIDRALRRGLVYAVLSLLGLVAYLALTVSLTAILSGLAPGLRGLAALAALLAAALAFEPARRRVQAGIDRLLYPDRLNFQRAVGAARQELERVVRREQIIRLLAEQLPLRLGAEWASLTLAPEPEVPGQQLSEPAWNGRLVVAGQPLGRYWLGPRRLGPPYDSDELAQLNALVAQAAMALAYADTIEALRQLNRELEGRVSRRTTEVLAGQRALAAYEERQRLARELHDSVTQSLFSINLSARALRNLVHRDPQAAVNGLGELEGAAQLALAEMRALLAQLRTPAPDGIEGEAGVDELLDTARQAAPLAEASFDPSVVPQPEVDVVELITAQCAQLKGEPGIDGIPPLLEVHLCVPAALMLPERQAHEILQIVREALHNVVKHSGVRQATCSLEVNQDQIFLEVKDAGHGFGPTPAVDGYGLRGIRERVAALSGRVEINSAGGHGVVLRVVVPFEAPRYNSPLHTPLSSLPTPYSELRTPNS